MENKKINVNKDACIGCGACVAIDSEHFAFDDDGLSSVINNDNLESDNLTNAIESCPTSAISLVDSNCNCGEDCNCGCKDGKECTCDDEDCGCKDDETCGCDGCDNCNSKEEN